MIGYLLDSDDASVRSVVDYRKITHLNIAFTNPTDESGSLTLPPHLDQLVADGHARKVKVMISIGGGDASEIKAQRELYFSLLTDLRRKNFVQNLMNLVDQHRLDGIDVDLEGAAIARNYGAFIRDLSIGLRKRGKILTAAVAPENGGANIPNDALARFDYLNDMAYDATGPWNPSQPGQHAPIEMAKSDVQYWISRGVPKRKLVLGLPFYGHGFGAAFSRDDYTYLQILQKYPGAEKLDRVGNTIWYNGIPTIKAKTNFALEIGLAGVMIWELSQDAKGERSLLNAIDQVIKGLKGEL